MTLVSIFAVNSDPAFMHRVMISLLVLGFGFVIFWHELGHFLAAKWVGHQGRAVRRRIRQAMFAWRKGIGFRVRQHASRNTKTASSDML